jgi:uncharacterized protein with HEPN domain
MKKDNLVYIEDILNSCDRILQYVENKTIDDLAEDQMMLDAIVRNIIVIGEAANKLDENFRLENPDFPVRDAITMRNKIVHDYDMVDVSIVWDTVKHNIPDLRELCESLLSK